MPKISTWEGGSTNNDEPQSLQNLWAADLFPNLYSERLSEPWDMTVALRGWWTEGLSAEARMLRD